MLFGFKFNQIFDILITNLLLVNFLTKLKNKNVINMFIDY